MSAEEIKGTDVEMRNEYKKSLSAEAIGAEHAPGGSTERFPMVSFITVNFNSTAVTVELLESAKKLTYPNFEIIVVDNNSKTDPSADLLRAYPDVKIILSPENLGFAGGNNLGIKQAGGSFLFFINNDTELTTDILDALLETFRLYPDAGIVSPKFHYFFHPELIEYAGYNPVNAFTGRNSMIGCREPDKGQYESVKETHYAHGGAMMVPKKVIEQVGMMPEIYFLYYEEFDWCEQIKRAGFKIYYQNKSLIYHKESMTIGKVSALKTYYLTRNRILFMRRNFSKLNLLCFTAYFTCLTTPVNTLRFLLKRDMVLLKAFWKGISWNLTNSSKI